MVLYQNPKDWNAATSLSELVDGGEIPEDFEPFFPNFKFQLRPVRDYLDKDLPPGLAKMGISVMKLMWDPDFSSCLDQLSEMLHLVELDQVSEIELLLVYASTQIEASQKLEFLKEIQTKLKPMGTEGTSIYDALKAEGEAEGVLRGQVQLLIIQAEAKFPKLSESDKKIISSLNSDQLEGLAIDLFTIDSLSELRNRLS